MDLIGQGGFHEHLLPNAAEATIWPMDGYPLPGTLWVDPEPGNVLTVEYSTNNGRTFHSLISLTDASVYKEDLVSSGFTHLKITTSGIQGGTWGMC